MKRRSFIQQSAFGICTTSLTIGLVSVAGAAGETSAVAACGTAPGHVHSVTGTIANNSLAYDDKCKLSAPTNGVWVCFAAGCGAKTSTKYDIPVFCGTVDGNDKPTNTTVYQC